MVGCSLRRWGSVHNSPAPRKGGACKKTRDLDEDGDPGTCGSLGVIPLKTQKGHKCTRQLLLEVLNRRKKTLGDNDGQRDDAAQAE